MCTRTEDVSFVGLIAKFGVSLHLFVRSLRAFVASWIMQATGRNMQYEENVAVGWAPIRWPTWSLTEYKLNVKLLSIYQLNLHTRTMQSWSVGASAASCIRKFVMFILVVYHVMHSGILTLSIHIPSNDMVELTLNDAPGVCLCRASHCWNGHFLYSGIIMLCRTS